MLYQALASKVQARLNCIKSHNDEWLLRHKDDADTLVKEWMPSGSGFDSGTTLNWDRSTGDRLVFHTAYHHMNNGGYYDGWTEHDVVVRPSLVHGFTLSITGRDRRQIKDYIAETFDAALRAAEPVRRMKEAASG